MDSSVYVIEKVSVKHKVNHFPHARDIFILDEISA